jgi:hypothetical protein
MKCAGMVKERQKREYFKGEVSCTCPKTMLYLERNFKRNAFEGKAGKKEEKGLCQF